jgi:two-component system chemotaxis response regulator CheV
MQEVRKVTTEVGTNEWQVVVFYLGDQPFAINVDKTREILRWHGCREIPETDSAMIGITSVRGEVLPMIDLRISLGIKSDVPLEQTKIIIAEFNETKLGFVVDAVERIYRINSEDLDDSLTGTYLGEWVLYVIKRDSRNVLLLDYEAIVQKICPHTAITSRMDESAIKRIVEDLGDPSQYRILVAEDSPLIRRQIEDVLSAGGFTNVKIVPDGKTAHDLVIVEEEDFDIVITDVEMPKMDGLTLTRKIRENSATKDVPIIVFSSIMAEDIKVKAASIGANYQVTKPEINMLVEFVVKVVKDKKMEKAKKDEPVKS